MFILHTNKQPPRGRGHKNKFIFGICLDIDLIVLTLFSIFGKLFPSRARQYFINNTYRKIC